jgi:isopentenyl phosphate kinase
MAKRLYFLKLGGSIITDTKKPNAAKVAAMKRMFKEIREARSKKDFDLIIGHGSGSFAHVPAHKYKIHLGLINKNSRRGASITQHAAARLNRIVVEQLIKSGVNAVSFPPSEGAIADGRKIKSWNLLPLKQALKNGFVPVTYGDVVVDTRQGVSIASTEEVFSFIASKLHPQKIMLATDVDGVFDKNPKIYKDGSLIASINGENLKRFLLSAGRSQKTDVTGGMYGKLSLLHEAVKRSRATGYIVNGTKKGNIRDLLLGRKTTCTKVLP